MPNKSKNKGDNEERAVVNLLRERGFDCKRTLESGARSDGSNTWDIDLHYQGFHNPPLRGECKIRKKIPDYLYKWLGENDFLTIRGDRGKRIWVFNEDKILKILREAS